MMQVRDRTLSSESSRERLRDALIAGAIALPVAAVEAIAGWSGLTVLSLTPLVGLGVVAAVCWPVITVILPVVYVDNPIVRSIGIQDSSVYSYGPVAALLAIAGAVVLWTRSRPGVRRLPLNSTDIAVAAFVFLNLLAALAGAVDGNPAQYLIGDLFQALEFAGIYFLVRSVIIKGSDAKYALMIILVSTTLAALSDLSLLLSGVIPYVSVADAASRSSRLINQIVAFTIPVLAAWFLHVPRRYRKLTIVALVISTASLLVSLTRGLWLGAGVGVIVLLVLSKGLRKRFLIIFAVGAAVLLVGGPIIALFIGGSDLLALVITRVLYTPAQIFDPSNPIQSRRLTEIQSVAGLLPQSPILGFGLGATYIGSTGASLATVVTGQRHYIHDGYAAIAFRSGLAGLAVVAWLSISFITSGVRSYLRTVDAERRALIVGIVCSFIAILVSSLTQNAVFQHPVGVYCGTIMALVAALACRSEPDQTGVSGDHSLYTIGATSARPRVLR